MEIESAINFFRAVKTPSLLGQI